MRASGPATRSALTLFQFFPGPANATFSSDLLFGIFNPADEFVSGQGRDIRPGVECRRTGDQRHTQVSRQLVHDPTGHSRVAHELTVLGEDVSSDQSGVVSPQRDVATRGPWRRHPKERSHVVDQFAVNAMSDQPPVKDRLLDRARGETITDGDVGKPERVEVIHHVTAWPTPSGSDH